MAALFVALFQEERHLKRQRVFQDKLNPLDSLCDVEVIERYRLPRQEIFALCDLLNMMTSAQYSTEVIQSQQ